MATPKTDPRILELCKKVTAKRPRTVIDHILKHGHVTTEVLQQQYGYDHPPRAARDVREHGIPLETFWISSQRTKRKIAAYRFADPSKIKHGRIGGRKAFSKKFKDALLQKNGSADAITCARMDARYLQIDHRIPYEVAGDDAYDENHIEEYMLLDASSQRAKSWSCEQCENWKTLLDQEICKGCYWAHPESYSHVAMEQIRRVDIIWKGGEIAVYEKIKHMAKSSGASIPDMVKTLLTHSCS